MSQYNEDEIILELLERLDGTYVDIGAGHPVSNSNTWALYQRGVTGLLIEPLPEMCRLLREKRPKDTVEQVAAGCFSETSRLFIGGHGTSTGLSSLVEGWCPDEHIHGTMLTNIERTKDILDRNPEIRDRALLCSIDVEGYEEFVIRGIDFGSFRPELFVVESLEHGTSRKTHQEWEGILTGNGYAFVGTGNNGLNRFYKK